MVNKNIQTSCADVQGLAWPYYWAVYTGNTTPACALLRFLFAGCSTSHCLGSGAVLPSCKPTNGPRIAIPERLVKTGLRIKPVKTEMYGIT